MSTHIGRSEFVEAFTATLWAMPTLLGAFLSWGRLAESKMLASHRPLMGQPISPRATAYGTPIIGNFQSLFRTAGADLEFTPDLSGWNGGTEVALDPFFSSPGAAFMEFGTFGSGGGVGLGTVVFEIQRAASAVGLVSGSFHAFFDLEVDEVDNTFFNEYGEVEASGFGTGVDPNAFEIDEPGFVFGNIDLNFRDGNLDHFNNVPFSRPNDVSVALGWEGFTLDVGQNALLTLVVSLSGGTDAGSSFALRHIDPESDAMITFSGALDIQGSPQPGGVIPKPSTLAMFAVVGLIGSMAYLWRRRKIAQGSTRAGASRHLGPALIRGTQRVHSHAARIDET